MARLARIDIAGLPQHLIVRGNNRDVLFRDDADRMIFLRFLEEAIETAYGGAVMPKRLVGITNGGHLTFSDLCTTKNAAGQDLLQVANAHMVCGANLAGFLFDCDPAHIDGPTGWAIINDATSAVLENTLQCNSNASLAGLMQRHPEVATVQEQL